MKIINKVLSKYHKMSVVTKSSLWFVICGFLQRGISLITTPIFSRLLQTSEYGGYSVFNSWLEIITIITTLKLSQGVYIQGMVKYDDNQDALSSSLLGLSMTWCAISFVLYILFRDFWNNLLELSTYMMVCMFAMILSTAGFNFWAAKKRNEFSYVSLVKLTIAVSLLKPLSGIIAILLADSHKVEARIGALALVEVLCYSVLAFRILKKGRRFYNKEYWKYALSFNIPLIPHFLSQVILNHSDRIMIKRMVGLSEAGIYSLAYSVAMVLTMLNTSIQNTLRPWMFQKIKAGRASEVKSVGTSSLLVVALFNLLLIAFSPELVAVFAPTSYKGAVDLIAPITMAVFFAYMYNLFVNVQMYYEKTKSVMIVAIICAIINIITNYYFIGKFGYVAAAYTTLGSYMLMAFLHYLAMRRILKKYNQTDSIFSIKEFVVIAAIFTTLGTILGILAVYRIIRFAFVGAVCLIVYFNRCKILYLWQLLKNR